MYHVHPSDGLTAAQSLGLDMALGSSFPHQDDPNPKRNSQILLVFSFFCLRQLPWSFCKVLGPIHTGFVSRF